MNSDNWGTERKNGHNEESNRSQENMERRRSSFNISPPTLQRRDSSGESRIFASSAFRPTNSSSPSSYPRRYTEEFYQSETTTYEQIYSSSISHGVSAMESQNPPQHLMQPISYDCVEQPGNHDNFLTYEHQIDATTRGDQFFQQYEYCMPVRSNPGMNFAGDGMTESEHISHQNDFSLPPENDNWMARQLQRSFTISPGLSSIAEMSSVPSTRTDYLQRTTPVRIRPSSTVSFDTTDSSAEDNFPTPFRQSTSQSSKKKSRRRPVTSPTPSQASYDDDVDDKSPAPQNLRGDPFRSAKVKTELCRHYKTAKGCPFGNKCNYAHGEHELKFTKLLDLKRAGLVDIEIFRTHPCVTWVATGACPFDQRCIGLHDPLIAGDQNSIAWLPHAETNINSVGSGANIDKFYHERISSVYSCSPIYGYVPKRKWKEDPDEKEAAWKHFCSFIWNEKRNSEPSQDQNSHGIEEEHVLEIVLAIRKSKIGQSYSYLPSHLFCGELCMVLQKRYFRISHLRNETVLEEVTESEGDGMKPSTPSPQDPIKFVRVHELAFGPVGDPSVRPVSIWFDIPSSEIVPCTLQQAKHQKRSRHRLRSPRAMQELQGIADLNQQDGNRRQNDCVRTAPFYHHQPRDDVSFEFITKILTFRLQVLKYVPGKFGIQTSSHVRSLLTKEYLSLKQTFESLTRFWTTWAFPFKALEGKIDQQTDVPPVDGNYRISAHKRENFHSEVFFGTDNDDQRDLITSRTLQLLPVLLWKSFIINLQLCNGTDLQSIKEQLVALHEPLNYQLRRLPVFRQLSLGKGLNRDRHLPNLKSPKHSLKSATGTGTKPSMTLSTLFDEWDYIEEHYTKGGQNTLRQQPLNQSGDSDPKSTHPDSRLSSDKGVVNLLDRCAQMWTRIT